MLLFCLVFCGLLAALFLFTMWGMIQTPKDEVPKHHDQLPSPGLKVIPKSVTAQDTHSVCLIQFPIKGLLQTSIIF